MTQSAPWSVDVVVDATPTMPAAARSESNIESRSSRDMASQPASSVRTQWPSTEFHATEPLDEAHAGTGQLRQRRLTEAARPLGRVDQVAAVAGVAVDERRRKLATVDLTVAVDGAVVGGGDWRRSWCGAGRRVGRRFGSARVGAHRRRRAPR